MSSTLDVLKATLLLPQMQMTHLKWGAGQALDNELALEEQIKV